MHILYRWMLSAVALYATVVIGQKLGIAIWIEPGTAGVVPALIAVAALSIVNAVLGPILKLLSIPLTCLTLGLFGFVINAFLFWLVGQFVPGFHVRGFVASLYGAIVTSIISGLLNNLLISKREARK